MSLSRKLGLIALAYVFALVACAAPSSYMGISLKSNGIDTALQQQAQLAMSGDKQAQLDLGIRFEEGLGVQRDLHKAKKLYRQAAANSGGTILIYSPPVGNGTNGRVISVDGGGRQVGLHEAKIRQERLTAQKVDE